MFLIWITVSSSTLGLCSICFAAPITYMSAGDVSGYAGCTMRPTGPCQSFHICADSMTDSTIRFTFSPLACSGMDLSGNITNVPSSTSSGVRALCPHGLPAYTIGHPDATSSIMGVGWDSFNINLPMRAAPSRLVTSKYLVIWIQSVDCFSLLTISVCGLSQLVDYVTLFQFLKYSCHSYFVPYCLT